MYHSINMEIRSIWPIILNKPHWPWVTSAIFDKDAKLVAPMVKNPPAMQEIQVRSLGWKIPWRKERLPTPVFLPGNIYGQRSLAGYSSWGCKELDTTEWLTLFILFFSKPSWLQVNSRHTNLWFPESILCQIWAMFSHLQFFPTPLSFLISQYLAVEVLQSDWKFFRNI